MDYTELNFKIPIEAEDYEECSLFVTQTINEIIVQAVKNGKNKIVINSPYAEN